MKEVGHLFPQLLPGASCSLVRQLSPYSPLCLRAPVLQADSFLPSACQAWGGHRIQMSLLLLPVRSPDLLPQPL